MQVITILVIIFIIFALFFRNRIVEEYRIMTRKNVASLKEIVINSFFVPLTNSRRTELIHQHLQLLKEIQAKLPDTLLAKYFVDYRDEIAREEQRILERIGEGQNNSDDTLSFSTLNLHQIYASASFKEEELNDFGDLLDAHFEDSIDFMMVNLKNDLEFITIGMNCDCAPDKEVFQDYVNDLSQNLFKGKKLQLQVEISKESEHKVLHFSNLSNP
jgi:hypothetical protein